jgi:DNA-binding NtrC family response regulator
MAKILVIDDEESLRYSIRYFLEEAGHEVSIARNYEEASACDSETNFDLVISDILLEGKTGIDFLREHSAKERNCPVVLMTGYPNLDSASEAIRLGAFDYLAKPVEPEALLRVTNRALQHKKAADEKDRHRSHLDAIFRSVGDTILTLNRDFTVIELNEEARHLCGLDRSVIGKKIDPALLDCGGECLEAIRETIEKGEFVKSVRIECRRKKNPFQIVNLAAYPLVDPYGSSTGAVMVLRDESPIPHRGRDPEKRCRFHNIVGESEPMQKVYSLIEALADVETTVLITGESGTGKELVGEALHYLGARREKPLVKINCSALPEHLLESELFGHVKGAFTGALSDRVGRFQRADGGTVFLDEIGDISTKVQQSLLRVLQEKEFERVGDSIPRKVDVRILAATHKDLEEKVKRGEFREDLYYRLKVVEVHLPPLRDRREDIPLLVAHFLEKLNRKLKKKVASVSYDVERIFARHSWPGNLRELEHALAHALILCRQDTILAEHLPPQIRDLDPNKVRSPEDRPVADAETIVRALAKTGWNKAKAARLLGIDRKTLYRKIADFGIQEETP